MSVHWIQLLLFLGLWTQLSATSLSSSATVANANANADIERVFWMLRGQEGGELEMSSSCVPSTMPTFPPTFATSEMPSGNEEGEDDRDFIEYMNELPLYITIPVVVGCAGIVATSIYGCHTALMRWNGDTATATAKKYEPVL